MKLPFVANPLFVVSVDFSITDCTVMFGYATTVEFYHDNVYTSVVQIIRARIIRISFTPTYSVNTDSIDQSLV